MSSKHYTGANIGSPFKKVIGFALMLGLAACNLENSSPQQVSAVLDGNKLTRNSQNFEKIMSALHKDASVLSNASPDWYSITLAGFNYIDDQCAVYFDNLFGFERRSKAVSSGLNHFSNTTGTILSLTGANQITTTTVAQAFGLASSLMEVRSNSFLYSLPPATTKKFTEQTMVAYRTGLAKDTHKITSAPIAYWHIRNYLNKCLPATIEGELIDHVSNASAVATTDSSGSIGVKVFSPDQERSNPEILKEIKSIDQKLQAQSKSRLPTNSEQLTTPIEWYKVQQLVCYDKPDRKVGKITRQKVAEFFEGRETPRPSILKEGLSREDLDILLEEIDRIMSSEAHKNKSIEELTCKARGVASAKEAGQLSK